MLCLNQLQTYVIWNTSTVPYIPPSYSFACTESALSPAPSLVQDFTVNSYSTNGNQITLDMDWSPPSVPNGELVSYEICIGGEPLAPTEDPTGTDGGHTCTSRSHLESVSYGDYELFRSCTLVPMPA